jgi:mono/diheme cytochrome c family protein
LFHVHRLDVDAGLTECDSSAAVPQPGLQDPSVHAAECTARRLTKQCRLHYVFVMLPIQGSFRIAAWRDARGGVLGCAASSSGEFEMLERSDTVSACSARQLLLAVAASGMVTVLVVCVTSHGAEAGSPSSADRTRGRALYQTACAACHGADGRGVPQSIVGFDTPIPDFSDCSFATPETDADWMAVMHDGGPARAFDRRMPAFGEALSEAELQQILDYVRGFCTNPSWPRGELNLPRALVTEKAFPENETVLTTTIGASGTGSVGNELLYEQRLGARGQFEAAVPLLLESQAGAGWQRGLGDVAVAVKGVLFHSLEAGRIFSVSGEIVLPTGKESAGLDRGITVFEPFVTFGQILAADGFLQLQTGMELPTDTERASREVFGRAVLGRTFTEGRFGRAWSPMVEVLAARELEKSARVQWDLLPQMQITLNRRQHLMLNAGVRIPVNDRRGRRTQVIAYFLWDWFDGGLLDGWR